MEKTCKYEDQVNNVSGISGILVFKTSLQTSTEAQFISGILNRTSGIEDWCVDLDDWEKILRIKSSGITASEVKGILQNLNIQCKELNL